MPRFCANISLLFTELPLTGRFAAAKAAGFGAVEILFPYELPARTIAKELNTTGLALALINTPAGDWAAGERGFAARPDAIAQFRAGFETALDYAQTCRAEHIHIMAGLAQGADARAAFIENLSWAASRAPAQALTIEPINRHDMPGYFLNSFEQAADILDAVNAPNLGLQFDAYHAHRITGDVGQCWATFGARASHVQVAGAPGRHEPAGGEIDYKAFFARLDREGYAGRVSGEYFPAQETVAGLGWLNP